MQKNASPWSEKFGWFWYNDFEIFEASDAELEKKILKFRNQGINHLITFSCTHFRWNFINNWEPIHNCLKRICQIAHKHGMRVTEHHSAHLTFNPVDEESRNYMLNSMKNRHCDPANWHGLLENMTGDPVINGHHLSSFRQIDGNTGRAVFTMYKGYGMCFNNPDYVREYLKYLERVYACGVDGIMTDDVQYFGESCACPHCRKKFRETAGYELPEPGEAWKKWFGNYEDKSFTDWLAFRADSLTEFHCKVKEHYEQLGLKLLRPWYRSTALFHTLLNYYLEPLPALDWVFQEACYGSVIRYSWLSWALEQKHRISVARQRNIPSMVMFYPERQDQMDFSWAMCRSWGSMYLATFEGEAGNCSESKLRELEKNNAEFLDDLDCAAKIGFYDSFLNRLKNKQVNSSRMTGWMQCCILNNIPCDLFSDREFSRMNGYSAVSAADHGLMSDPEVEQLLKFAEGGGTLIISSSSGIFDENMQRLSTEKWLARWQIPAFSAGTDFEEISFGNGKIITVSDDFMQVPRTDQCRVPRGTEMPFHLAAPAGFPQMRKAAAVFGEFLLKVCPESVVLDIRGFNTALTASLHRNRNGHLVLQLVNTGKVMELPENAVVSHADKLLFLETGSGEITIKAVRQRVKAVKLTALDVPGERELDFVQSGDGVTVMIPENSFQSYALIKIKMHSDN